MPPHIAHVTYPTRPAHCLTVTLELLLARRTPAGCGSRYRSPNEPGSDIPGYRTHDTPPQVPSHRDELTPTPAGEHYHLIRAHPKTAMPASWQRAHPLLTRELLQWWGCYSSVTLKDSRITGGPGRNFIRSIRCRRPHGQPRSLSPLCAWCLFGARVTTPTTQHGSTSSDPYYPMRSPALTCAHAGNTSLGASTPTATSPDGPPTSSCPHLTKHQQPCPLTPPHRPPHHAGT